MSHSDSPLTHSRYLAAIDAAKQRFSLLKQKHPTLKAYLVVARGGGQSAIGSSVEDILKGHPALLIDNAAKAQLKKALSADHADKIAALIPALQYDGECQIELRFDRLDYELIWRLQTDELVDWQLTPQTKASIRVVLGTLAEFAVASNSEK